MKYVQAEKPSRHKIKQKTSQRQQHTVMAGLDSHLRGNDEEKKTSQRRARTTAC